MCIFAVQTVSCGNIAGSISKPIQVTQRAPIDGLQPMESHGTRNSDITEALGMPNATPNTVYIISISFLATALIISATIFITVIAINMRRSKAKIKAALNRAGGGIHNVEPVYEDVTGPSPSVSAINTLDNVAYGHTKT
jgi:hypothetical protein